MDDFQQAQQLLLARGPADAARAAGLFRRAAERGNALAEYDYGYCFEHGLGVPRDPGQALAWYQRAASHAADDAVRSIALAGVSNIGGRASPAR
jgi:TPR repeat protein